MKNLFWFIIIFFSACSGKNLITAETKTTESQFNLIKYYIRYIEQSKEIQLEAKYFGKNDSAMAVKAGVFVSDVKLDAKKLPKEGWIHRYIKRPADYDSLYVFRYEAMKGQETKDSVYFRIFNDFKLETIKISKKNGGLLSWSGNALSQDEGLTLVFEDASGMSYTINHVGITRGPKLEIRPEHIEVFAKGKAILRVVHKKTEIDKKGNIRMVRLTEYYRSPIQLEITE